MWRGVALHVDHTAVLRQKNDLKTKLLKEASKVMRKVTPGLSAKVRRTVTAWQHLGHWSSAVAIGDAFGSVVSSRDLVHLFLDKANCVSFAINLKRPKDSCAPMVSLTALQASS